MDTTDDTVCKLYNEVDTSSNTQDVSQDTYMRCKFLLITFLFVAAFLVCLTTSKVTDILRNPCTLFSVYVSC